MRRWGDDGGGFKPIETFYRGNRFRSRLEARWAVLFDELGIAYRYEQQGYRLDTAPYLPDFYLPEWRAHVEIKPNIQDMAEGDYKRALELAGDLVEKGGELGMVIFGRPWPDEHLICAIAPGQPRWMPYYGLGECRRCEGLGLLYDPDEWFAWLRVGPHTCEVDLPPRPLDRSPRVERALRAASSARFEYGETPR